MSDRGNQKSYSVGRKGPGAYGNSNNCNNCSNSSNSSHSGQTVDPVEAPLPGLSDVNHVCSKDTRSSRFMRRPIAFKKESQSSHLEKTSTIDGDREESDLSTSDFYKHTISLKPSFPSVPESEPSSSSSSCPICGGTILDQDNHQYSSVHIAALSTVKQPLSQLKIDPQGLGYKYLTRHGWKPHQRHGLGAKGREGSRTPITVKPKNDKAGLGASAETETRPKEVISKTPVVTAKDAKEHDAKEKRRIQRIVEDLR